MGNTPAYQQTLAYLYERLPMFSRIGKAALKPDLSNTLKLCAALGDPQNNFRSVHIAGTNGKGSVSHALAAVLQDAGYKTGLYTSPHLVDFRERIRINGEMVHEAWVVAFVERIRPAIEEINPSFFEITVAMAFAYFAEQQVDIAIIETGLGGRLDSTNVITPLLSIITNISYDHKDLLGDTLADIAREKAGIIKQGVPVVVGEQHPETEKVFFEQSVLRHSVLHYASSLWGVVKVPADNLQQHYKIVNNARLEMFDLHTDMAGNYQQQNIKTVLTAVELLMHQGFRLTLQGAINALGHVNRATGLRGRWEIVQQHPTVICDVAHNTAGMTEVIDQLERMPGDKHIVLGFVKDKDIAAVLALFPQNARYYFTNAAIQRALPADELKAMAQQLNLKGDAFLQVGGALEAATLAAYPDDTILVTGSFFVVGEVLAVRENTRLPA